MAIFGSAASDAAALQEKKNKLINAYAKLAALPYADDQDTGLAYFFNSESFYCKVTESLRCLLVVVKRRLQIDWW